MSLTTLPSPYTYALHGYKLPTTEEVVASLLHPDDTEVAHLFVDDNYTMTHFVVELVEDWHVSRKERTKMKEEVMRVHGKRFNVAFDDVQPLTQIMNLILTYLPVAMIGYGMKDGRRELPLYVGIQCKEERALIDELRLSDAQLKTVTNFRAHMTK